MSITLILLIFQLNTDFFKYYLKPLNDRIKQEKENKNTEIISPSERDTKFNLEKNDSFNPDNKENNDNNNGGNIITNEEETNISKVKKRKEISFFEMFKILMDLDILRTYINFISNTLFPKAGITQSLFSLDKYKTVTILILNNFTDFFGRYIVLAFKQTKLKTYIISIGRTVLVFLLIFNYYCEIVLKTDINITSILLIMWIVALGLTHGMGNSLCFGLAPTMVEDDLKLQAGSSMSFFTVLGLFLGSCLTFLTKFILEEIDKKK